MPLLPRVALLVALVGCRSTAVPVAEGPVARASADEQALRATVERLYAAFSFDPGAEPDWTTQRALFLDGATFVAPLAPGSTPTGVDTETFLDDFERFVRTGPYAASGLHERILRVDLTVHGDLAHAFVLFEGHLPGRAEAETRGLDGIQFVRAGDAWQLVSFTTLYGSTDAPFDVRHGTFPGPARP